MQFCYSCGARCSAGTRYCGECGADLAAADHDAPNSPPPATYPEPTPDDTRHRVGVRVAAVVALLALTAAGTTWAVRRHGDEPIGDTTATTSTSTPSTGTVPPPAATTTVTAPPAASTPPGSDTGGQPGSQITGQAFAPPAGSYVLVLASLPQAEHSAQEAQAVADGLTDTVVVDSSTAPWLNAGYWAVVSRTPHATSDDAIAACAAYGRTPGGTCYARKTHG